MSKITVVPLGICHESWVGAFYPDDLPCSWRLSYFANEFSTGCLTTEDIEALSSEVEDFAEDLPARFRCTLYLTAPILPEVSDAFAKHVEAVLINGQASPSYLSQLRKIYGQEVKIYSLESGRLPLCHTFGVHAQLHCRLVSAVEVEDLRSLKGELTKCINSGADEIIILVDSGTDIVLFRNVATLVSLLA